MILALMLQSGSCKNEDDTDPGTDPETVISASRFEVVTIDLGTTVLTQAEFSGKLGKADIKLQKTGDNKLTFMVPFDQTLGDSTLEISSLGKSLRYDIKDVVLTDTPENIVIPFKNNLQTFAQTLDTSDESLALKNSFTSFNTIFNSSTNEEKQNAAKFYLANKTMIDDIILNDYNNINREITGITYYDRKFYGAVLTMGVGAATCVLALQSFYASPNLFGPVAMISGVVAIVGMEKAKKYGKLTMENNLTILDNIDVDGYSIIKRGTSENLTLNSGVTKITSFNTKSRALIAGDRSITKPRTQDFFTGYDTFNKYINQLNQPITDINNRYPILKIPLIPLFSIATTNPTTTVAATNTSFANCTFSMNDANINLDNVSFNTDGKINLKASIKNTSTGNSYNGDLLFTYNDEFNTFTGKLPITVNRESVLDGIWKMDFTLAASGDCDENLLEDEAGVPPTFHFNPDGTLTFDSCAVEDLTDLNNPAMYTNTYTFENNLLKIKSRHIDSTNGEEYVTEATLNYDSNTRSFSGNYTFKSWINGAMSYNCANTIKIYK